MHIYAVASSLWSLPCFFFNHGISQTISFKTQSFHFSQAFELLLPPSFHRGSEEENHPGYVVAAYSSCCLPDLLPLESYRVFLFCLALLCFSPKPWKNVLGLEMMAPWKRIYRGSEVRLLRRQVCFPNQTIWLMHKPHGSPLFALKCRTWSRESMDFKFTN